MINIKQDKQKIFEYSLFYIVILFILINGVCKHDSLQAIISAICGISYTFLAGKGKPICYIFGVTGSSFYGYLSLINGLFGNLLLYVGYYIPMQITGYINWNKNLKSDKNEIVKTSLGKKERIFLLLISIFISLFVILILYFLKDKSPVLDGITTTFSVVGMYLTVKRCLEQWICWMIVNLLSLIMWINVVQSGGRAYSTVIMWAVYLFLAVYFYFDWKREISVNK